MTTKPANILAGPPSPVASPATPEQPESYKEAKEQQRRRVHIWCEACQKFHRLPKPAIEVTDSHQRLPE